MNSNLAKKRSHSNEKLDFHIRCENSWWSDLLDDDLKQHFTRLKLNNIKDSILTRPINSTHRIDAQRYLYETFNEKLKQNTLYTNFDNELNRFISIDARKYKDGTFNEKLKPKNNDPTLNKETNKFINEYEKELFNSSNNDYIIYKRKFEKLVENLELNDTILQRLISLEIKPCQLAQMSEEQMKQQKEIYSNNEGKEKELIFKKISLKKGENPRFRKMENHFVFLTEKLPYRYIFKQFLPIINLTMSNMTLKF
jgi:hypothetical protein